MKVKNIAFSGFAAMILAGVCGVASAATYNLASKNYVDTQLAGKASIEDFENLESTVGQKATQEALKEVADQVVLNTNDIAELKAAGYVSDADLTELQKTLQAAIDEKQAAGNYADATELESLKTTVETLQNGEVSKETVDNLQASVNTIVADYAKKSELTSAEERLQSAIDAIKIPDVSNLVTSTQLTELRTALEAEIAKKQNSGDYATVEALQTVSTELATLKGGVYTKDEIDKKITDAISGGQIDLSGYATTSALDALTLLVNGNTIEINALKNAGYQTSAQVQGAITTVVADLATKAEVNAKQDKLTQGTNISIEGNVISATGLAKSSELTQLQETLQAAIDEKQAAGEYLVASDLTELSNAITALQSGKADASTVATIQETISKLGDTYATEGELTSAIDDVKALIPSLDDYVKSSDLATVAKTGQYADLEGKPEIPSIAGLAKSSELTQLQETLQAAIDEKQAAGEYLVAADLTELSNAITALQTGKADKSTVETIQTTINNLGNTYATKSDMTAADTALQNAIDAIEIPSLAEYAKTADVDAKLALKADATALTGLITSTQLTELRTALEAEIAKKQDSGDYATAEALQTISTELGALKGDVYTKAQVDAKIAEAATGGEIDLSGYATTSALDALTALVNGKQDKLTAGTGITITDNTISASVDTSSFMVNPTNPGLGDYVLYASCTSKKCVYSLESVESIMGGSSSGGGGYDDF